LDPARPTLLVLAYARCTMLCNVLLRGVVDVARRMEKVPGRDYKLVLIGLDDRETLDEGRRRQSALLAELVRGDWSYLHGDRASIDAIADPLGFRYAWDPRTEQYAHPAVMFVLTPEGRAARYLHGLAFDPHEVNAALDDAASGRLLSTPAAAVLRCFQFDPAARRNGPRIALFMRLGAALVFLLGLLGIGGLVRSRRRRT
jgi:protein SCO1/2